MKNLKKYLPSILVIIAATFFLFNLVEGLFSKPKKKPKELSIYFHPKEERSFAILTVAHNNKSYVQRNLYSVLEQSYKKYRVLYIDDASTDGSFEEVLKILSEPEQKVHFELIQNETRLGTLESLYAAIQRCKDNEVVVFLDGNDWLAHDHVLETINRIYDDESVWMTYGSHLIFPYYKKGKYHREIPDKIHRDLAYRKYSRKHFIDWHLTSAYGALCKKIRQQDLMKEGKYLQGANYLAFVLPLLEMTQNHAYYIRDILYLYNRPHAYYHDKKERTCRHHLQSLNPYPPLTSWRE